ncbi:MAG: cupin domain-containing protein [bacterium]|nr:cupin domain-containing protein [bacterium]
MSENLINEVLKLKDKVEYSDGAIVSKTIFKKDNSILTLFALDKGQSIAEHVTPFDALVQILEGEAELVIGGKKVNVKLGESIIMPKDIPHALYAKEKYKMLLVMLK